MTNMILLITMVILAGASTTDTQGMKTNFVISWLDTAFSVRF